MFFIVRNGFTLAGTLTARNGVSSEIFLHTLGEPHEGVAKCMGVLDNKVAVITGASSGIGRAVAKLFASEGAKIVVAARRQVVKKEQHREFFGSRCAIEDIQAVDGDGVIKSHIFLCELMIDEQVVASGVRWRVSAQTK